MSAVKSLACTYTYCIIKFFNLTSDLFKFGSCCLKMFRDNILNCNIPASCGSSKHKSSCLDLVRNDRILCTMKFLNTLDTDNISSRTLDVGSHTVQEVRNVYNMRLSRCILDRSTARCHRSCHHNVDRRTYRYNIKENMASMKVLCLCNDRTMKDVHICT